jgi:hypothetical protein
MVKIVSSLAQAECMFFKSLALVLCRPPFLFVTFALGIVLIVRGEIGGGVCLPQVLTRPESLPTIDFRTYVAWKIHPLRVADRSVSINFAECALQKFTRDYTSVPFTNLRCHA